jgi:hemolysin activation/secretion protein
MAQTKAGALKEPTAVETAAPVLRQIVAITDVDDLVAMPSREARVNIGRLGVAGGAHLQTALTALLHRPIDSALLDEIRSAITASYVVAGRPYMDVGFPQQDITDGVLQVVVTEYRLGNISVEGNAWFSEAQIRRRTALEPGRFIDKTALDGRLSQINGGSFLTVTPEFKAGTTPGTTDVVLRAEDKFPVRITAGYDNSGAPTTGIDRWSLGATWGNALWLGQVVNYQFSSSTDFYKPRRTANGQFAEPSFTSHSGGWQIPLPWGHNLAFSGSFSRQSPNLGADLGSIGLNENAGIQYNVPAPGLVLAGYTLGGTQQFSVGYDFKRSNNDLSFGGTTVSHGFSDVSQFFLRYDLSVPDAWGQTSLQNNAVFSPGGMTPNNNDAAFQGSAAGQSGTLGARSRYAYNRLMLSRLTPLPRDYGLLLRVTGQITNATLLPSEQLAIAGIDSVRGYQEGSITGSTGFTTTVEMSSPVFSPSFGLLGPGFTDTAQLHVFWDYGQGFNRTPSQNNPANFHTASLGIGGHYEVGQNLTLRIEQGFQLKRDPRQSAKGAFAHVSLQVAW